LRVIRITAGPITVDAELNDSRTAGAIAAALPIEAKAQTWGDEIYFDIRAVAAGGIAARGGRHGRPRLLAARPGVLHFLRRDSGEPGRRDPPGQPGQRRWPGRG